MFPELLISFIFVKYFPIPLDPISLNVDSIPLNLRIPDDFVAPEPCKIGYFHYKKTKHPFFFSHPEVLKNYFFTMRKKCYGLKELWISLCSNWELVLKCIDNDRNEKLYAAPVQPLYDTSL